MADRLVAEPPPTNPHHDFNNFSTEFDSLPIPPLHSRFFSEDNNINSANSMSSETYMSDLGIGLGFDENADFELNFDDLEDLYLPSETEDFLISDGLDALQLPGSAPDQRVQLSNSLSQESGASSVSSDRGSGVAKFLNFPASESDSHGREYSPLVSSENSGDRDPNVAGVLNFPSPDSGGCDREFSAGGGSVSSQGSGYRPPSPDSSNVIVVDQKIKVEEGMGSKNYMSKRKKEQDEGIATDSRTTKYRRSSENANFNAPADEEEEKRKARLMRNRESAQLSRQRKKHYVEELEDKLRTMHSTISELNSKISYIMAENATLRQQLSGGAAGGMCAPHSGMFPHPAMAPVGYPWVPCPPYVVKSQGSQVPLVPIPRLKPQQPVSAPKAKKSESKKSEGKTKKVASVSFLGLLFFVLLFGGLVPFVNVRYGGVGDKAPGGLGYVSDKFYGQHRGMVLSVNSNSNGSGGSVGVGFSIGEFDTSNRVNYERGRIRGKESEFERKGQGSQPLPASDEVVPLGNTSEPLVASLYVPRNDKLVKIDGNLIIHSVLASEKAMASHRKKVNRETGLAIPGDLAPALAIPEVGGNRGRHSHLYRNPNRGQKALATGSTDTLKDHLKSTAADGKLQQWFREGLAGPMLSSGMCTEVFHFDVSPASASGAIVPASSVSNVHAEHRRNATRLNKGRNRRILHGLPAPLAGSNYNITEEHIGKNSQKEGFQGNKSSSSMIVSVLVDPREVGDIEVDDMITSKSLSRIFVVVLLDRIKYVTYSCVLPRSGPHLVTT